RRRHPHGTPMTTDPSVPSAPVRVERREGVAEIVLSNGDRGNTIDLSWAEAFEAAFTTLTSADRCVLLRAEGPNFCFGGDVSTFVGDDPGERIRDLADRLHVGL